MVSKKLASIIVRTKNEQDWIGKCIDAIKEQSHQNFEIIVVDTGSTDATLDIVSGYKDVKLFHYEGEYRPGKVLNFGCQQASGEVLVFISAHCVPVNERWLAALIEDLEREQVAGVYGRQEPTAETDAFDRRDLTITFGLDRRIQWNDPFFHNANSAMLKKYWDEIPFNDEVTNIEDRVWAASQQKRGRCVIYEPEASVYHHHGIHQANNEIRCKGVNHILENIDSFITHPDQEGEAVRTNEVWSVIAFSEAITAGLSSDRLFRLYDILNDDLKKVSSLRKLYLLTDSEKLAEYSKANHSNIQVPYLREKNTEHTQLAVLQEFVEQEKIPDSVAFCLQNPIFLVLNRHVYLEQMTEEFMRTQSSSALWITRNYSGLYQKSDNSFYKLDEDVLKYRLYKNPYYRVLDGLGKIISTRNIRNSVFHDSNTLLMELKERANFEFRMEDDEHINFIKEKINRL